MPSNRNTRASPGQREQHRINEANEAAVLRSEIEPLRAEPAELRAEMDQRREVQVEAFGQALGEYSNEVVDHVDAAIKRLETAVWTALERRFAEVSARLDLLPDGKPRARSEFKFANERDDDEITELPNPLPPRRAIN